MEVIIYLATNRHNGKRYVGVTGGSIAKRKREHAYVATRNLSKAAFPRAICKYGIDAFDFIEIDRREGMAEAKTAERDWISNLRPEYNSTLGGDGQLGRPVTQRMRDRAKEVHSGNKYRLGATHTAEARAILKRLGHANVALFENYRHLRPAATARPVMCRDDGEVYVSASEASRAYGVSKSALIELCLGKNLRKTVGGRRFVYLSPKAA